MNGIPDLVVENILRQLPTKQRASTRLISSQWDLVVMSTFGKSKKRLFLRGSADINQFVETFSCAKYGIPLRKFCLSPNAGSLEDFLVFAKLVGPFVVELTADNYRPDVGPAWPLIKQVEGTNLSGKTVLPFLDRLSLLLQQTPNLQYLGISHLGINLMSTSTDITLIPLLPKLRILSSNETEKFSAWYEALLHQSPQLKNAKEMNAANLTDRQRQDLSKLDPCLITGHPLKISLFIDIRRKADESTAEVKLIGDAKHLMFLEILFFPPNVPGEQTLLRLPFHPLPALMDLCYRELSYKHPPLVIQNGQFPALRRVVLNVLSFFVGKYPFEGCVFPTVEVLTLVMDQMKACKHWNLQTIFPNISTLSIYTRRDFGKLKDLLWSFGGSSFLKILLIQNTSSCKLNWSNLLGLGKNHLCKSGTRIHGIKRTCATSKCPSVVRIVFPAVKILKVGGVILNEFLPRLIRSVRRGGFPELQCLELRGHTGAGYSDEDFPNVGDYKVILEAMNKIVKLEINGSME